MIFKHMGRESTSRRQDPLFDPPNIALICGLPVILAAHERCDRCGGLIFEGDWPWCKGKREDHNR